MTWAAGNTLSILVDESDPSKKLKTGKQLRPELREPLVSFLRRILHVFAWEHSNMIELTRGHVSPSQYQSKSKGSQTKKKADQWRKGYSFARGGRPPIIAEELSWASWRAGLTVGFGLHQLCRTTSLYWTWETGGRNCASDLDVWTPWRRTGNRSVVWTTKWACFK